MRPFVLVALAAASPALAEAPDAAASRDYLAEARAAPKSGDPARAEAVLAEGMAARPSDPAIPRVRGAIRVNQGRLAEAEADFRRSISIQDNASARASLGRLELHLERHAEALVDLRRAVELDPDLAWAWALLADAEMIADHPTEGMHAINQAVRLDPDDPQVREIQLRIARFFNMLSILRPKEATEHHARGGELAQAGRWREAMAEYEEALRHDPNFADCHYNLGLGADALGDLERAEREYVLAIRSYESKERLLKADAMNNLVYVRVRRGRATPEDVESQRRAIAMSRETVAKLDTLGRACEAAGDRPCALEAFGKVAARADAPAEARRYAEERLQALRGEGRAAPR